MRNYYSGISRSGDPWEESRRHASFGVIGRSAEAAKGTRANLAASGMSNVPGVSEAVGNIGGAQTSRTLAGLHSQYDIDKIKFQENQRQFNEQLAFAREQFRAAKSAADKAFWGDLIGSLIGAGGKIASAGLFPAGALAGAGVALANNNK